LVTHSVLLTKEPRWLTNRPGMRRQLPAAVQSWIYEPGSLTTRLRSGYGDKVAVKLLQQQWARPLPSERALLRQATWHCARVREVLLHADGLPLLLARTVIPAKTLNAQADLLRLGARPLGEVLFSHPNLERWHKDVVKAAPQCFTRLALELAGIEQPIWGRRTVYALNGKEMLVCEFFLPTIINF